MLDENELEKLITNVIDGLTITDKEYVNYLLSNGNSIKDLKTKYKFTNKEIKRLKQK